MIDSSRLTNPITKPEDISLDRINEGHTQFVMRWSQAHKSQIKNANRKKQHNGQSPTNPSIITIKIWRWLCNKFVFYLNGTSQDCGPAPIKPSTLPTPSSRCPVLEDPQHIMHWADKLGLSASRPFGTAEVQLHKSRVCHQNLGPCKYGSGRSIPQANPPSLAPQRKYSLHASQGLITQPFRSFEV